ncbi:MAG: hypothetical protein HYY40_09790 [Bacteroidetes bacterium]|nr:hypothetical protein [Bacteroidota bacterium]
MKIKDDKCLDRDRSVSAKLSRKPVFILVISAAVIMAASYAFFAQTGPKKDDSGKEKSKTKSVVINIDEDEKKMTVTTIENGRKKVEILEGDTVDKYIKKCGDDYMVMAQSGTDKAIVSKTRVIAISGDDSSGTDQVVIDFKNIFDNDDLEKEIDAAVKKTEKVIRQTMKELEIDSLLKEFDIDVKVKDKKSGGKTIIININ